MEIQNKYRKTSSAIIFNEKKEILLTHNIHHDKNFYKFPQGGIENQENPIDAVLREMDEELGTRDFSVVKVSETKYSYIWDLDVQQKKGFIGPELTFVFLKYLGHDKFNPNKTELDDCKWVLPDNVIEDYNGSQVEFLQVLKILMSEFKNLNFNY